MGEDSFFKAKSFNYELVMTYKSQKQLFIPSIIVTILLLIAIFPIEEYSYYILLRWVVCLAAIYFCYYYYKEKIIGWAWIMGIIAIIFNPLIPLYLKKGIWAVLDFITAIIFVKTIFIFKKKDDSLEWHKKGKILVNQDHYKEALRAYNKSIKLNPDNSVVLSDKGSVLCKLGRYREALEVYMKAIDLDPGSIMARYGKGYTHFFLEDCEESIKAFDSAIKINPEFVDA